MPESHLRAADRDRAAVADVLGKHMAAGRLTVDEYDQRLARTYAARTYGELDALTADLPAITPATRPVERPAAPSTAWTVATHGAWDADPHSWRSWATTSLIVLAIWAATSLAAWDFLYFWPVWVIGPWGAVLLAQTLMGGTRGDGGDRRQLGG